MVKTPVKRCAKPPWPRAAFGGVAGMANQQPSRLKITVIAGEPGRHEPGGILGITAQTAARCAYRGRAGRPWRTHAVEGRRWRFERSYLRRAPWISGRCRHIQMPGRGLGRRPREWSGLVRHGVRSGARHALASGSVRAGLGTSRPATRGVSRGEWSMVSTGRQRMSSLMVAGGAARVSGTSVWGVSCCTGRHAVDDGRYPPAGTVGRAV